MSGVRAADGHLLGAVLAGGASRRLGRDKAAEPVGGRRMIDRAVSALEDHCTDVVVVSSRADTPSGAWRRIEDARPDGGPLCGIEAALLHARASGREGAIVLAVDLPLVGAQDIGHLVRAYHAPRNVSPAIDSAGTFPTARAVAAKRTGQPDFEPLCAIYATGCLPQVQQLLDRGERAAQALFRSVDGRRVPGLEGAALNVNEKRDLEAALTALEPNG